MPVHVRCGVRRVGGDELLCKWRADGTDVLFGVRGDGADQRRTRHVHEQPCSGLVVPVHVRRGVRRVGGDELRVDSDVFRGVGGGELLL